MKKREYSLSMNFVISQSHSVNSLIYANTLWPKFLLLHFVLLENIKLLRQIILLFTASE